MDSKEMMLSSTSSSRSWPASSLPHLLYGWVHPSDHLFCQSQEFPLCSWSLASILLNTAISFFRHRHLKLILPLNTVSYRAMGMNQNIELWGYDLKRNFCQVFVSLMHSTLKVFINVSVCSIKQVYYMKWTGRIESIYHDEWKIFYAAEHQTASYILNIWYCIEH